MQLIYKSGFKAFAMGALFTTGVFAAQSEAEGKENAGSKLSLMHDGNKQENRREQEEQIKAYMREHATTIDARRNQVRQHREYDLKTDPETGPINRLNNAQILGVRANIRVKNASPEVIERIRAHANNLKWEKGFVPIVLFDEEMVPVEAEFDEEDGDNYLLVDDKDDFKKKGEDDDDLKKKGKDSPREMEEESPDSPLIGKLGYRYNFSNINPTDNFPNQNQKRAARGRQEVFLADKPDQKGNPVPTGSFVNFPTDDVAKRISSGEADPILSWHSTPVQYAGVKADSRPSGSPSMSTSHTAHNLVKLWCSKVAPAA